MWSIIQAAGWPIWPLIFASVIALALIFERLWSLRQSAVAHDLERFLTTLGTIATAAPLLGLFGTVIGMIEIFGSQSPTTGATNPQQLAHGISIALYNTAFGIGIAIPALIFYRHYKNKVDGFVVDMEQQAAKLIDIVHGERSER